MIGWERECSATLSIAFHSNPAHTCLCVREGEEGNQPATQPPHDKRPPNTHTHTCTHTHTHMYAHAHTSPTERLTLALVDTAPACLLLALKAQTPALGGRMLKDFFEVRFRLGVRRLVG